VSDPTSQGVPSRYLVRLTFAIAGEKASDFAVALSNQLRQPDSDWDVAARRMPEGGVELGVLNVEQAAQPMQARAAATDRVRAAARNVPGPGPWPSDGETWPRWLTPMGQDVRPVWVAPLGGSFVSQSSSEIRDRKRPVTVDRSAPEE
jgi:hypothetical protein